MKAKVVRAPPSRGWHQWFSYCCFTSWPVTNIKQMVEDSTESASVNLLIYSMWQNSPVFIPTHYTARNTVIQKGGGGPVMLPVFKIVQIVLRPARHNSIFTVLACIFYSVLHILILYLLSLLAKLAFCFALHFLTLPTYLACLLSRDTTVAPLSLSIFCKVHVSKFRVLLNTFR